MPNTSRVIPGFFGATRKSLSLFTAIPATMFIVILYYALVMNGISLDNTAFDFALQGELSLILTNGDVVLFVGLIALFMELVKATHTETSSIINHGLSMAVFSLCLILLFISPYALTGTFFTITTIAFIDIVAGFIITIVSARRDFGA